MNVVIALLRAVNLGGHNRISMDMLRALCEGAGCCEVRTLLQSGNVVFATPERRVSTVGERMADAIKRELGFRTLVITRTHAEWQAVVANSPFAGRKGLDPSKLLVTFLANHPSDEARKKVLAIDTGPEELHIRGRELYMYFPNGLGRPNVSPLKIEKALGIPGTGRNWATVSKLLELAEQTSRILETSVPGDRTKAR